MTSLTVPPGRDARSLPPAQHVAAARRLTVQELGLVPYPDAVRLQDRLAERRLQTGSIDTLLVLEHPPVVTLGRRATLEDVLVPPATLTAQGIAIERSTRGGLVTYHGPGQLVGYPIVSLRDLRVRLPDYIHGLERVVQAALASIGVQSNVDEQHVGIWTPRGKIAAIGVALRHGITLHGFAVNLNVDLSRFALVNACGIGDLGVTSAASLLGRPVDLPAFSRTLADSFRAHFGYDPASVQSTQ